MTLLSITEFSGEIPKLKPQELPDGSAVTAQLCDFSHADAVVMMVMSYYYGTTSSSAQKNNLLAVASLPDSHK